MQTGHSHVPALDGVRGIALIIVVLCHTHPQVLPGGNIGVDLFFVLSGFLITSILLREQAQTGAINFRNFYLRRACRLLPALALVLLFEFFFAMTTESGAQFRQTLADIGWVASYSWNWVMVSIAPDLHRNDLTHLWSLSVEEQFYIIWPVVLTLVFMTKTPGRNFFIFAVVVVAWATLGRILLWKEGPSLWLYFRSDLRFDSLIFGAATAWLMAKGWRPNRLVGWCGLSSLALFVYLAQFNLLSGGWLYRGGYLIILALGALLIAAATNPPPTLKLILEMPWLRWTGKISYGLYLWHVPMFHLASQLVPDGLAQNVAGIVATVVVSSLSFYWIERPFLDLKRRYYARSA